METVPLSILEKIWFVFFILQIMFGLIHYPVFKFITKETNINLNINYEKVFPFWSINIAICAIYTGIILLFALLK